MELSRNLRVIMSQAFNKAREAKSEYLMPEHILYSIVQHDEEMVDRLDIDAEEILNELNVFFQTKVPQVQTGRNPVESLGFNQVVQNSVQQVENSQRNTVEIGDIMVAIFDANGQANYILQRAGVERTDLLEVVSDMQRAGEGEEAAPGQPGMPRKKKSALAEHAVELVEEAREGRLDPIIGREDEIERTVQILCRKKKNNPIHVGESGVGKCLHADENIDLLVPDELYEQLKEFI